MNSEEWLITGATGLLGSNSAIQLSRNFKVTGAARSKPPKSPIPFIETDLSSSSDRVKLVSSTTADTILHCAAISTHEACENNPEMAFEINATATRDLSRYAYESNKKFVYISTDAVFDGQQGNYSESDPTSPVTVYAKTKRAGEIAALEENPNALILRVNFYGWSPSGTRSLAEYFFNRLMADEIAPGFTDVVVSTMYVGSLISSIQELVALEANGIFHVANAEATSKYDFGRSIAMRLGKNPEMVIPSNSQDILSVVRGADTSLNTSKLRDKLQTTTSQSTDLDLFFKDLEHGKKEQLQNFLLEADK